MALNYDGVYEIRLFYSTVTGTRTMQHRHTFDVGLQVIGDPTGLTFDDILVDTASASVTLSQYMIDYVEMVRGFYHSTSDFQRSELWYIPEGTTDAKYIATWFHGVAGTHPTGSTVEAQQATLTFRSAGGGVARLQFMQHVIPGNYRRAYPTGDTNWDALMQFVIGVESAHRARDNTKLVAPINAGLGQNEKLWRKIYRD